MSKRNLNEEQLEEADGGGYWVVAYKCPVFATIVPSYKIQKDYNDNGEMIFRCPTCDEWYFKSDWHPITR